MMDVYFRKCKDADWKHADSRLWTSMRLCFCLLSSCRHLVVSCSFSHSAWSCRIAFCTSLTSSMFWHAHTHRVMLNTQTITDGRQFAESDRSAEALVNKKQANMHVHLFTNDMKKRHKEKHDNKFGTISDLLLSNIYVYSSHRVHLISVLLPERLVFIWSKWHTE